MNAAVQIGHDGAGVILGDSGEISGMQPLEQQSAMVRVGTEQTHRAVATPALQHQMLVLGFRIGEADLEHGGRTLGGPDRQDQ